MPLLLFVYLMEENIDEMNGAILAMRFFVFLNFSLPYMVCALFDVVIKKGIN